MTVETSQRLSLFFAFASLSSEYFFNKMKDVDIVGHAIAEVLPQTNKYWFQIPHLRRLNMILLIPLLSSAVAGYDGMQCS